MLKYLAKKIVGLNPQDAIDRLEVSMTKKEKLISAALKSALYNAINNHKLDKALLVVKSIEIQKGPFFKRWQPVSRGMAHQIQKRTTHIKIILTEKKRKLDAKSKEEKSTQDKK